jgi:hypothetical protein
MNTCNRCSIEIPKKKRYCDKCRKLQKQEGWRRRYHFKTGRRYGEILKAILQLAASKKEITAADFPQMMPDQAASSLRYCAKEGRLIRIELGAGGRHSRYTLNNS